MIIFNLYAILVAVFIAIGATPILALKYFNLISDDLAIVLTGWEALLVSILCHTAGVKGRLFYIPMWILGIPVAFFLTYMTYGWAGIFWVIGPVIGLVGLVFFMLYRSEKKRANGILYEPEHVDYDGNPLTYLKAVKEKIFLPTFIGLNASICEFNARVAKSMEQHPLQLVSLTAFRTEMDDHARAFDRRRINDGLIKEFSNEIDAKIAILEKEKDPLATTQLPSSSAS